MSLGATDRQLKVHAFMLAYQREHSMPPTIRDIQDAFSFKSTNAVTSHLVLLAKKGLVSHRTDVGRSRCWLAIAAVQS